MHIFETESSAGNSEVFMKTLSNICIAELGVKIDTEVEVTGFVFKHNALEIIVNAIHTNNGMKGYSLAMNFPPEVSPNRPLDC